MAANILSQEGAHTFKYTTVTGKLPIVSGMVYLIGNTPMVALESATVKDQVITMQVGGSVLLPKRAAAAATGGSWAVGGRVYLTTGEDEVTGLATAALLVGYGLETTTTGATTAKVQLIEGPCIKEDQT